MFLIGEAHYATQLAVWNALKQIDINDLDFRNKNVEKVTKDIVAKASASAELQEITMSVTPTEEQEAVLKNDFFETGLYTVETNAKVERIKCKQQVHQRERNL